MPLMANRNSYNVNNVSCGRLALPGAASPDRMQRSQSVQTSLAVCCSRAFAALIVGSMLGIIGYSGWSGFLWYFLMQGLVMPSPFSHLPHLNS